ncbi:MAG: caspase, partial [Dysgonamonadaceae bacterium]|nr:caspase [Dysgonamonadaceae bacterium]
MKRFALLTGFLAFYTFALQAQTAEEALRKGNQQYVLFESERDKGANMDAAYNLLLDSYVNFKTVVETAADDTQRNTAKARLRSAYSWLEKATLYYAEANNGGKALQFAIPYVEIPKMTAFRSELLPRSDKYSSMVYYAGVAAYKLDRPDAAAMMFREYIDTGGKEYEKDSYMYLNMIYQAQKNYREQENILERAYAKYPLTLDFLYNLINVHITTKNMDKLLVSINKVLEADPNNEKVLPIKARLLESAGKNDEALEIYRRLYTLYPGNFELLTGLARANFNKATGIINAGATIYDDMEYAKVRQQ